MLEQLSLTMRRHAAALFDRRFEPSPPKDGALEDPVLARQAEIGMLRGVTPAAADVAECTCPDACERDHANE